MIHSMGFPIGQGHSETLMSVVLVSFYDFDLCVSDAAAGLNPNYRTTLSFPGIDVINDNNLWHVLETEGLRLELEAFLVGATAAAGGAVIGTSHISLSEVLQRSEDPNPTITGEAVFAVAGPSGDVSQTVGTVRYKIRFRHPIVDHYDQWRLRKATEDLGRRLGRNAVDPAFDVYQQTDHSSGPGVDRFLFSAFEY
ncbi:hypothetical protein FOZ63_014769 [Perkinsus olseni]|uniref:RPGR-interacting protein 1 first C2 domain-containing protein n=1 Tax=Perkinsus olseni TaxID=32597 RepID=A0A7J6P997_PEROL|nr:hypothetical protein FOZ62_023132 [Perkinsus olseni]KAF4746238.1 hypothetical protein FOZ63_014769 [Perkinsus olseni]